MALLGTLAVLGQAGEVAADVHREWDGNWYWKGGGWIDYAPSGVPDFDQKQGCWGIGAAPSCPPASPAQWTYCGPVAAANSLWWFDSKFEPFPVTPPTINDNYYLVMPYQAAVDDHDPMNAGGMTPPGFLAPPGLIDDLAWYFDTDGMRTGIGQQGSQVRTMFYGLQWYLYGGNPAWGQSPYAPRYGSYYDEYHIQLVKKPTFEWVEKEVERSEDVILLLGFWQLSESQGEWVRLGGHYVTVAGINSTDLQIALSDPFFDNAEAGGPGYVYTGTILPHQPQPGHPFEFHNDAGNASHDIYTVTLAAITPGGLWEIDGYPYDPNFDQQNLPKDFEGDQGTWIPGPPVIAEVEYAIAMSPFYWKPGGEWVWLFYGGVWMWEWWWYEDDGDSCLSDFWWGLDPSWEAYDGPVAVANSFWWFDSKAETLVTGGWPTPPPAISDTYSLLESYDPTVWDDHAISNTVPFISDLGTNYLNTSPQGTTIVDMTAGINAYLADRGVGRDFYTKTQASPSFEWVADEIETSEDVILLLGFWEYVSEDIWERKGGHWVNAAGVNRDNWLIGLSDPTIDNAITPSTSSALYLGRVFPPEHLGVPFTPEEKKDPQSISHDIYRVVTGTLPGGHQSALAGYPATSVITSFIDLNGGGTPWTYGPISTTVEWAIGVSPYSDLVITKTALVTRVVPGDKITYTLEYANTGLAATGHVTITDKLLLSQLTDISYASYPPLSVTPGITYVWTIPKLSYGQTGVITITAQSLATTTLTNTTYITGLNAIGGPTPDRDPSNNTATATIYILNLDVTKQADPDTVQAGALLTYTIRITNTGDVELHATITDTLPAYVTPTGTLTWPVTITVPSGAWTQIITRTVVTNYTGVLTNVVQVKTEEGATGVYTETSLATSGYDIYLPIIMKDY